ncbi:MAG TPA: hypothetical protein VK932_00205 [Kofleriaceae bacterium]|nr:hypothetical protein [Kofleriaceae bacterium]
MEWTPVQRIAFRFCFLVAALLLFPFPIGMVPATRELAELLTAPLEALALWCATAVLGLAEPSTRPNGSGDTTYAYVLHAVVLVLAAAGAAVWSVLDRRRTAYPRLAAAAIVVLRYYLAYVLLSYAFAKLTQFPPPRPERLDQRVGDLSPMGLMWTFMGASRPYALFGGLAEALGGVLLLWRRTHVAGALVAMATMLNVVALNFCYDVPVKLFSMQLLLAAAAIFAPHAPRLIGAVLGRAAAEVPPRPRRDRRFERARLAAKVATLALMAYLLHDDIAGSLARMRPRHELHGIWVVEKLVVDGVERPPLTTDRERWHKLYFSGRGGGARAVDGPLVRFGATVKPAERTIEITAGPGGVETWRYTRSTDGERTSLVVDGTFRGERIHAELRREPEPLLLTRGFHWVNEAPFNR